MKNVLKFFKSMLFSSILKCSEEKNSSMVTILIINTLFKEFHQSRWWASSDTGMASGGKRPWYYSPVRCEHWLQAQRLNPLEGHVPLPLGWLPRAVTTSAMDRKQNRRCNRLYFLLQRNQSHEFSLLLSVALNNLRLEQLSAQLRRWRTGRCRAVRWYCSCRGQAGGPSDVSNTLVLLQGDGLRRYIRVQAVQLGNRPLSATTLPARA